MSDDDDRKKLTNSQKWWAAVVVGIIFIILASGPAFAISNNLLKGICFETFYGKGGPTLGGLLLHGALMVLIVRLAIENANL